MNIFKRIGVVFVIMLAVLGLSFGCAEGDVYADGIPDYRLAITPTQRAIEEMVPGNSYEGSFKIRNSGKRDFDYTVSFTPYSVSDEAYEPDYDKTTRYTEIANWITVDKESGFVESGNEVELKYRIDVPADIHGGAQAATIMITMRTDDQNESTGFRTVRRLGYLIFGNVNGEVTKTGKILENKIPTFLFKPPILGTSVVENTGNVYTVAKYSLQVFPLFSDEEVYTNEEEPENSVIFPETKRYNEIKWGGAPHLGIFRVRQTVKIFDEESVTEKIVFLCPLWFLFIVLLLIFCIIFWIVSRALKRKREA